MIKQVYICDLCYSADGTVRLAKHEYFSEEMNETFHSCPTHTRSVIQAGMSFNDLKEQ